MLYVLFGSGVGACLFSSFVVVKDDVCEISNGDRFVRRCSRVCGFC
jgi:hypothetical protein